MFEIKITKTVIKKSFKSFALSIVATATLLTFLFHPEGAQASTKRMKIQDIQGVQKKSWKNIKVNILSGDNSQVLDSKLVTSDNAGNLNIDLGTHNQASINVRIKPHGFLSKVVSSQDLTSATSAPVSLSQLAGGDVNDDNVIDDRDFDLMGAQWNQSNTLSDVNGDGVVNSLDFMLLKSNFGQIGQ